MKKQLSLLIPIFIALFTLPICAMDDEIKSIQEAQNLINDPQGYFKSALEQMKIKNRDLADQMEKQNGKEQFVQLAKELKHYHKPQLGLEVDYSSGFFKGTLTAQTNIGHLLVYYSSAELSHIANSYDCIQSGQATLKNKISDSIEQSHQSINSTIARECARVEDKNAFHKLAKRVNIYLPTLLTQLKSKYQSAPVAIRTQYLSIPLWGRAVAYWLITSPNGLEGYVSSGPHTPHDQHIKCLHEKNEALEDKVTQLNLKFDQTVQALNAENKLFKIALVQTAQELIKEKEARKQLEDDGQKTFTSLMQRLEKLEEKQ